MKISRNLNRNFKTVPSNASLKACAEILAEIPGVNIVAEDNNRILGIFTLHELAWAGASGASMEDSISDYVSKDFRIADENDPAPEKAQDGPAYRVILKNDVIQGIASKRPTAPSVNDGSLSLLRRMSIFLDAIYNPIVAIDTEGFIIFCNKALARVSGLKKDEIEGRPIDEIFEDSQLIRIIRTGKAESVQKVKMGEKVYLTNRAPIMAGGQILGAAAVLQDISELEAISNELEHTKRISMELDAIIESSFDGIYVTDGQGRTIRVNKSYESTTGIRREDVLGRKMDELVEEGFFNESVSMRVLKSRKGESLVQKIHTGKTVMVTGIPIFDEKGEITLVVTNVRDVTELYKLQNELSKMEMLRTRYESEIEQLRESSGASSIVIRSKKMKEIYELSMRLAKVDATVLIQGESGVGKEVIADLIHSNSPRNDRPFVKISCAAIPEQLLESELFGYEGGAFTGAKAQGKAGIFETAHGGTIFLDEIGEMQLGLQAKMLRVLQEKQIMRVGSNKPIDVDVRILAATNRDLGELAAAGGFRRDLFFRLNVVPLVIPPLRERKEALISLAYTFLDKFNRRYGFSKQISPDALEIMNDYDWPGNVRELENTIERMVVITRGDVISAHDLPEKLKKAPFGAAPAGIATGSLKQAVEDLERDMVTRALEACSSTRKAGAALGVDQSTVVRKMKRYGISRGGGES